MGEADIRDFIKGIRGISPWNMTVVPQTQMSQVFQASLTDAGFKQVLRVGDWVRVKNKQPYKHDLAQIAEVCDDEYIAKMKPRIRYGMETSTAGTTREAREARKRPAPRWFCKSDVEAAGILVNSIQRNTPTGVMTFYLVNDDYYRDGFVYKKFKAPQMITGEQVRPQEQRFRTGSSVHR